MAKIYCHDYTPVSVYGHAVRLIAEHGARTGVHIDVGCGYGVIAQPVETELGLTYLGFDKAEDGLRDLRERGLAGYGIDLSDVEGSEYAIRSVIAGRQIASISMMDTLEHLTNGPQIVAMLRRLAQEDNAPLILSVPNVAHKDLALKLLAGRWDVTEAGLLDHTHVGFYTAERLAQLAAETGWREIGAWDWLLEESDQKFPSDLPLLDLQTPIGAFLRAEIDRTNPYSIVNQFVRAFRPVAPRPAQLIHDRREPTRPFMSIVIVASEPGDEIAPLLKCLAEQTSQDFDLQIICLPGKNRARIERAAASQPTLTSRTRIDAGDDGIAAILNERLECLNGRYAAILRTSDRPRANWLDSFASLARGTAGAVLKVGREGEGHDDDGMPLIGLLTSSSRHSIADFAVPAGLFRHQGLAWDGSLHDLAAQELVLRAAMLCGINASAEPVLAPITQQAAADADGADERLLERLNTQPLLLPAGSAGAIHRLQRGHSWYAQKHEESTRALSDAFEALAAKDRALADAAEAKDRMSEQLSGLCGQLAQKDDLLQEIQQAAARAESEVLALSQTLASKDQELRDASDAIADQEQKIADLAEALAEKDQNLTGALEAAALKDRVIRDYAEAIASQDYKLGFMGDNARLNAFLDHYITLDASASEAREQAPSPFLTVVTRTQGQRPATLRDTIMSLAGQSDQDFELLIMVHSPDPELVAGMTAIADEFPPGLRSRIRLIPCSRQGRAAPLNDAVMAARGQYIVALDDDDFVFAHWIETFRGLSRDAPGTILRATCARQDFRMDHAEGGHARARALSWFEMPWPGEFEAVWHLYTNYTPFMSVAFPARLFHENGLRFDENLTTAEDWDLILRASMLCGVASSPEVTAIYRWWVDRGSSRTVHAPHEWEANRARIIAKMNAVPILLPAGATAKIVDVIDSQLALTREREVLASRIHACEAAAASKIAELQSRIEWLATNASSIQTPVPWEEDSPAVIAEAQRRLLALVNSTSWRVMSPLRRAIARMTGRKNTLDRLGDAPASVAVCQEMAMAIRRSTSWRATAPLRLAVDLLTGRALS
jgi:GT2 family glycosyltransferase/2-polyprenyl-3-methyl-5-hydroxy-6-metoxy-1,4-benzoquinol methylase